jgi:hypothetical protein
MMFSERARELGRVRIAPAAGAADDRGMKLA